VSSTIEVVRGTNIPEERDGAASWIARELVVVAKAAGVPQQKAFLGYDFETDTFIVSTGTTKHKYRIPSEWAEDRRTIPVGHVLNYVMLSD